VARARVVVVSPDLDPVSRNRTRIRVLARKTVPMRATTFEELYLDTPRPAIDESCLSARAAYQAVLGDEAVLVDLRSPRQRDEHGEVHVALDPLVLSLAELTSLRGRIVLICADGQVAPRAAEALRRLGLVEVGAVTGGYAAWRASGMPVS
jgi:rhodanese-related sulfurtransferase